jgi:UDP-glucuronate decarboxylase
MHPADGRVVSNFIVQALSGAPITIYGGGLQTRAFCYVEDLVKGLIKLMETPEGFTGPVNLGNPDEFSVRALADLVLELTGSDVALIQKELPQDDPRRRKPDISIANRALGWEPKVSLRDGLSATITYFRQIMNRSSLTEST